MKTRRPPPLSPIDAERIARHISMLEELADLGVQLAARTAENAIRNPCVPVPGPKRRGTDQRLCFERLSREVHRALALKARIARDLPPDEIDTRTDSRHRVTLAWLQTEIAAADSQDPNTAQNGDGMLHGEALN